MKIASSIILVVIIGAVAGYLSMCPCGPTPGAWLFGDEATSKVTDWSFSNDRETAPLCQVQVTTWRPHSINLNCMEANGALYVSCSRCDGKSWSTDALTHPEGHIRIAGTVYPVTMRRVTDPLELDVAWAARLKKVQSEPKPRPDHWWSFQMTSR